MKLCSLFLLGAAVLAVPAPAALAASITPGTSLSARVSPESIFHGSLADIAPPSNFYSAPVTPVLTIAPLPTSAPLPPITTVAPSVPGTASSVPIPVSGVNGLAEQTGLLTVVGPTTSTVQNAVAAITPEPNSFLLLATGLAAAAGLAWRRRALA